MNWARHFFRLLTVGNVDVVFSAHNHTYGRSAPFKNGNVASQGTIYISSGRSGDKTWAGSPCQAAGGRF